MGDPKKIGTVICFPMADRISLPVFTSQRAAEGYRAWRQLEGMDIGGLHEIMENEVCSFNAGDTLYIQRIEDISGANPTALVYQREGMLRFSAVGPRKEFKIPAKLTLMAFVYHSCGPKGENNGYFTRPEDAEIYRPNSTSHIVPVLKLEDF